VQPRGLDGQALWLRDAEDLCAHRHAGAGRLRQPARSRHGAVSARKHPVHDRRRHFADPEDHRRFGLWYVAYCRSAWKRASRS
jgi:hypothetical protein